MWIRTTEGFPGQCPLLFPLKQEKKDLQSSKKTDALTRNGFRASCSIRCLFCSNQLSYQNHLPKVSFLHLWASYLQWRSLLKNREPARDWTALVREGLLRYRRHQEQERGAPLLVTKQLFCPTADSINLRFFLSRNFACPFYFRAGGNGIRTHDTIFLYVDLANQCLKPLSHTSKLLIGIGCAGLVARRSTA